MQCIGKHGIPLHFRHGEAAGRCSRKDILEVLRNSEQADDKGIYAAHIDDLRRLIRQQQREKRVLFGILTFLLIFLLMLYLDATHGGWGAIRYIE